MKIRMKKAASIFFLILIVMSTYGSVWARDTITGSELSADTQAAGRPGFWMSQKIEAQFIGMDIGDVDNDGNNEIVIIDISNIMIYRKEANSLKLLQKIPGEAHDQYLSVDVADIKGDGVKRIIVSSLFRNFPDSFILEHKDGKYVKIASNLRWFLRVIEMDGKPVLLGQEMGINNPFENPIYEIVWKDGKYQRGQRMKIPQGVSVYGLAIAPLEKKGPSRVIALDSYDYLRVYGETDKAIDRIDALGGSRAEIWKSDEVFGGSNNYFDRTMAQLSPADPEDSNKMPYVYLRIINCGIGKEGRAELVVARNFSQERRWFENLRLFTSGEVYGMEWDGLGFAEKWRTEKIQGYVVDYQIKNIDNNGKPEVVMALVTSGYLARKPMSVIVTYAMDDK
ncbi:MAG: FG-GAP repeat domain-containing protein [Syntrophales bacterium]